MKLLEDWGKVAAILVAGGGGLQYHNDCRVDGQQCHKRSLGRHCRIRRTHRRFGQTRGQLGRMLSILVPFAGINLCPQCFACGTCLSSSVMTQKPCRDQIRILRREENFNGAY